MLSKLIQANDISSTWLAGAKYLIDCGGSAYGLVVEIENPLQEDSRVRALLDDLLLAKGKQPIDTVASTIFPSGLDHPCQGRERLYHRYRHILPRLHKIERRNRRGLYFERLISWPLASDEEINQVEETIRKLQTERRRSNPLRSIYEMGVYVPGRDHRPIGFPCLSSISMELQSDRLHLVALYRNQYFVERAYGNYVGLARLQGFICREVSCMPGHLMIVSGHVELNIAKGAVKQLIRQCESNRSRPDSP